MVRIRGHGNTARQHKTAISIAEYRFFKNKTTQ